MRSLGAVQHTYVVAHAWGGMRETRERSRRAESFRCVEKCGYILRAYAVSGLPLGYIRGGTRVVRIALCEKGVALVVARRLGFDCIPGLGPSRFQARGGAHPEADGIMEGSRGGGSSVQRASSRRWPTAGGARGAVRGRGAKLAGAARCASQCSGCAAGASCIGIGRAQAGPVSAAAACVARRGGQTIFTVRAVFSIQLFIIIVLSRQTNNVSR